jgi:hypothetical protein
MRVPAQAENRKGGRDQQHKPHHLRGMVSVGLRDDKSPVFIGARSATMAARMGRCGKFF